MIINSVLTLTKEEHLQAIREYVTERTDHAIKDISYKFEYRPSGPNESEPYTVKQVLVGLEIDL